MRKKQEDKLITINALKTIQSVLRKKRFKATINAEQHTTTRKLLLIIKFNLIKLLIHRSKISLVIDLNI